MKIKRTLPSIIDIIKKRQEKHKKNKLRKPQTTKVQKSNINRSQLQKNNQQINDQQMLGQLFNKFNKKYKIFDKKPSRQLLREQQNYQINSQKSNKNIKLTSTNLIQQNNLTNHDTKNFSRKSIFNKNNQDYNQYDQGNITYKNNFNIENQEQIENKQNNKDSKLQYKVAYLQKLVDTLSQKLQQKNQENSNSSRWVQRINSLQRNDRRKSAELRRMNLQIQQYQRCQKIAKQNQVLYAKLASTIKLNTKRNVSQNVVSKFPSFQQTPRIYGDDEDNSEICSPFMVNKCLNNNKTERHSYYM